MMLMLVHTFQYLGKQVKLIVQLEPTKHQQVRVPASMLMQVTMLTKQVNQLKLRV